MNADFWGGTWFHGVFYPLFKIVFGGPKLIDGEIKISAKAVADEIGQDRLVEHFRRDGRPDSILLVSEASA